jgi:N-acetylglutamate synthase
VAALPDKQAIFDVMAATWPPHAVQRMGPVTIREGHGGGSRVSAATIDGAPTAQDVDMAEAGMRALGQVPIFMIRPGESALDDALAQRGYEQRDSVTAYAAVVSELADRRPPPVTTFEVWPPLAIQAEIWAAGGISPARLAVMDRVQGPHTTILGRSSDRPAGTAFVACPGAVAMVHALEVTPAARRQGLAGHMLRAAAFWAKDQGAEFLSLVVTDANVAANALYRRCNMVPVSHYHYRVLSA